MMFKLSTKDLTIQLQNPNYNQKRNVKTLIFFPYIYDLKLTEQQASIYGKGKSVYSFQF